MSGSGRIFAVRAGAALLMAGFGLTSSPIMSEAASPLTLSVQVGYRSIIKLGQWMPVSVDITNAGPNFDGTLAIETGSSFGGKGGPPGGIAVYETPVSLATGATKHFRTYITQDMPGTIDVRLQQGGRVVASEQASTTSASGLLVGVLSDQPTTLDALAALHPGGYVPNVTHIQGSDLSDSSLVLRAFDMLAIDDFSTDTLTAAQRSAIGDYVINGGSLFLGTGGSWHKTLGGLGTALLPMQVTGSAVLGSIAALNGLAGVEVATGTLSGGSAWLSEGTQPLLIEKRFGQGMISMATFDWNQEQLAGWTSATAVLRQAFVRATYGIGDSPNGAPGVFTKFGFTTSLASKGGQFSQALSNLPALSLPAWWLIGSLVLIYVLLIGPINYFVLRAINRRALAWVTVPALALVGSAGAYGAGVATKGTSVQANQVSVIHVAPGWDHAYQEAYTGLLAPTRGDYEVGIASGRPMVSPIYYYSNGIQDSSQAVVRINTTNDAITLPGMTAFTLRGFATEGMTSAPHLGGSAELRGGHVVGTIQNVSTIHFTDGVVLTGNSFQKLTRLEPNGSLSFEIAPTVGSPFTGPPAYMQIYPNMYSCCGGPQLNNPQSDAEREAELKTAVLSTLPSSGYNSFAASSMPTIVLWTKQPFQAITVNGNHPRTYTQSAVVLTLPVTQVGAGALPAGVVTGRMVDLDADIQSQVGPPGVFVTQSGSVTYDFEPTLAPSTRLGSAAISSSNMFGAKGVPVSANGVVPPVKGLVWDWALSSWDAVTYVDGGATTIPDSAINPSTGEVRMKLSSDGAFSSGYLSLTGTVQ